MTRVGPERDSPTKEDSRVICVVVTTFQLLYHNFTTSSIVLVFSDQSDVPGTNKEAPAAIPHLWSPSTWPAGSSEAGGGVLL